MYESSLYNIKNGMCTTYIKYLRNFFISIFMKSYISLTQHPVV